MTRKTLRRLTPADLDRVCIDGPFWSPRLEANRTVSLPTQYEHCRKTGRFDAFKLDWKPGDPDQPHHFWDSDAAKWIEAAAYTLATQPNKALERRVDGVIELIVAAPYYKS